MTGRYFLMVKTILVTDIIVKERKRKLDFEYVNKLALSIKNTGLIQPITVSQDNVLIAGYHRLEALKSLSITDTEVNVVEAYDLEMELMEIDENYVRKELTRVDKLIQLKRRREIYEIRFPETKKGFSQAKGARDKRKLNSVTANLRVTEITNSKPKSFIKDTSEKTGVSERTLFRDAKISSGLMDETLNLIKESGVELTQIQLQQLSKMPNGTQKVFAKKMIKSETIIRGNGKFKHAVESYLNDIAEELLIDIEEKLQEKDPKALDQYDEFERFHGKNGEYSEKIEELKPALLNMALDNFDFKKISQMINLGYNHYQLPAYFSENKDMIIAQITKTIAKHQDDQDKKVQSHVKRLNGVVDHLFNDEYNSACNLLYKYDISYYED